MNPDELKQAREKLKMSQAKIADELQVSERFWLYRESGVMEIPRWLGRAVRDLLRYPKKRP